MYNDTAVPVMDGRLVSASRKIQCVSLTTSLVISSIFFAFIILDSNVTSSVTTSKYILHVFTRCKRDPLLVVVNSIWSRGALPFIRGFTEHQKHKLLVLRFVRSERVELYNLQVFFYCSMSVY